MVQGDGFALSGTQVVVAAGDTGVPLVLSAPESAAGAELRSIADKLASRKRGLAGMSLGLDPAGR